MNQKNEPMPSLALILAIGRSLRNPGPPAQAKPARQITTTPTSMSAAEAIEADLINNIDKAGKARRAHQRRAEQLQRKEFHNANRQFSRPDRGC